MIPDYYEFYSPVKILSGDLALENIPHELDQIQKKRPMLISDNFLKDLGLAKILKEAVKDERIEIGAEFYDVPVDSSVDVVNEIAAIFRQTRCDSLIAMGGGSVIDTAKGVNIVISENENDLLKLMGAEMLKKPMLPLIVVPTTAGTGSEATLVAVIADRVRHIKMPFTSYKLIPDIAVLDVRMTRTLPAKITAATGMDALTHAIEAYSCLQKNPMSDAYAAQAIRIIGDTLVSTVQDGNKPKQRLAMANAALMAGIAFSNSMVGIVHSIGHSLGAVAHIPHGIAMSILLPYGMDFNLSLCDSYYAEIYRLLSDDEEFILTQKKDRGAAAIRKIFTMRKELLQIADLPDTLKKAGVTVDQFDEIAEKSLNDGSLIYNPREASKKEILDILEKAFDGAEV